MKHERATETHCDNNSTTPIRKNPISHDRTKQISIKYHFIREVVENNEIELKYCKTDEQIVDIFTKALPKEKFLYLSEMLGVQQKMH